MAGGGCRGERWHSYRCVPWESSLGQGQVTGASLQRWERQEDHLTCERQCATALAALSCHQHPSRKALHEDGVLGGPSWGQGLLLPSHSACCSAPSLAARGRAGGMLWLQGTWGTRRSPALRPGTLTSTVSRMVLLLSASNGTDPGASAIRRSPGHGAQPRRAGAPAGSTAALATCRDKLPTSSKTPQHPCTHQRGTNTGELRLPRPSSPNPRAAGAGGQGTQGHPPCTRGLLLPHTELFPLPGLGNGGSQHGTQGHGASWGLIWPWDASQEMEIMSH